MTDTDGPQSEPQHVAGKRLTPGALSGIKHREVVSLVLTDRMGGSGEEFSIEVRPLRHRERAQVQGILSEGFVVENEGDADAQVEHRKSTVKVIYERYVRAQYEAQLKAAAMGSVDPNWNEATIDAQWPAEWVEQVGQRVMDISNIGDLQQQVDRFQNEGDA